MRKDEGRCSAVVVGAGWSLCCYPTVWYVGCCSTNTRYSIGLLLSMKRKNWQQHNKPLRCSATAVAVLSLSAVSFLLAVALYISLLRDVVSSSTGTAQQQQSARRNDAVQGSSVGAGGYSHWREVAVNLAKLPADKLLQTLDETDPFGTRAFEKAIKEAEQAKGGTLDIEEVKKLWSCPANDRRISLPEQRDQAKVARFRQGDGFIFFQHLRKAGGTHFCSLAEANFPKHQLPKYFCMPDYHWPRQHKSRQTQLCAGCLHQWTNEEITANIKPHRIAGNEWDSFDPSRHFDLDAIFVTSFRKPVDRALSQFRFECIEDRGCKIKDVGVWWKQRRGLYNVYTWTFSDTNQLAKISTSNTQADIDQRGQVMGKALDTVARFHLVLAMEWLAYGKGPVETVLGFRDTSTLTRPVRPHNQRKQRSDSWAPQDYLTPEQYQTFRENLALDEILTDAAHRLFLERLVCDDLDA